jgi:hypothetical protein
MSEAESNGGSTIENKVEISRWRQLRPKKSLSCGERVEAGCELRH